MIRTTYIFPHVPKCGGTSIRTQLSETSLTLFVDDDAPPSPGPWQQTAMARRNREFALLDFAPFDLVFGHFPAARYDRPHYRYIALLRDPYRRALSQLNFQIARHGTVTMSAQRRAMAEDLLTGRVSPATWLRKNGIDRVYRTYLGGVPRERFALVGTVEHYGDFIAGLNRLLGTALDPDVVERKGAAPALNIGPDDEKQVRYALRDEYAWYEAFLAGSIQAG